MPRDSSDERFQKRKRRKMLRELGERTRNVEDLEAEREVLAKAKQERAKNPERYKLKPGQTVGRNDPCPCGSGKKYKKCCGAGK